MGGFVVEFDSRCETERRYDYLEFTDATGTKRRCEDVPWRHVLLCAASHFRYILLLDSIRRLDRTSGRCRSYSAAETNLTSFSTPTTLTMSGDTSSRSVQVFLPRPGPLCKFLSLLIPSCEIYFQVTAKGFPDTTLSWIFDLQLSCAKLLGRLSGMTLNVKKGGWLDFVLAQILVSC